MDDGDGHASVGDAVPVGKSEGVAPDGLEAPLPADGEQSAAVVAPDLGEVGVPAQVLPVAAADVDQEAADGQAVDEAQDPGPGRVPGVAEVVRDLLVHLRLSRILY